MQTLLDQVVPVHYHLFYIRSSDDWGDDLGKGGQANGLCGAAYPGSLTFTTGIHTGRVPVRVELHDTEPPLDPMWEEVVEASYRPDTADVHLAEWDGPSHPLPMPVRNYRVRFCGVAFDFDEDNFDPDAGDEPVDSPERYLVQFWPAPPAADRVVRETSPGAASWHRTARESPPPKSRKAREEEARRRRAEAAERDERSRLEHEARYWCGRTPSSPGLLAIAPDAVAVARFDRDLLDEIDAATPDVQRAMARWAARHICGLTGLTGQDWVGEGLAALDAGTPPPAAFRDFNAAFARLFEVREEDVVHRATVTVSNWSDGERPRPRIDPRTSALGAVIAARETDPLLAAISTVRLAAQALPDEAQATIAAFRGAFDLP
ncbi:hypothetical protein AB0H83_46575 [Dactylosporangium sp. NPDC050688]|uniref:hypothetical protein n=1 Tax=Dactylosporangium sp. NPDC050688 TaxID=3157217 RepID=UPI0033CB2229